MPIIEKTKPRSLQFSLMVEGSTEKPQAQLILEDETGIGFIIPCTVNNGVAKAIIPKLSETFVNIPDSYKARLEVSLDDDKYIPWNGEIVVEKEVVVESSIIEDTVTKKTPKVVSSVVVEEVQESVQEPEEEIVEEKVVDTRTTQEKLEAILLED